METLTQFSRQQRIVNTLLLNASFIDNPGLMHGKMGIAISFFHLARETGNSVYEDYAGELIDEIYEEIHAKTLCGFENGLAGIGCGIEYLVQNKFIDADTNEVLEEFDNKIIHEITFHTPLGIGILNGMSGYILYFYYRLSSNKTNPIFSKSLSEALVKALGLLEQCINEQQKEADAEVVWNEPDKFDLSWEYPATLWILSRIMDLQISTGEAKQLVHRLLFNFSPSGSPDSYREGGAVFLPKLFSHRLLLSLVIEGLKHVRLGNFSELEHTNLNDKLLTGINRDLISKELAEKSAFLQNGTSGIAFIYKELFDLTANPAFNVEYEYWKNSSYEIPESEQGYAGFFIDKENKDKVYGILNGIAGINLILNGKN